MTLHLRRIPWEWFVKLFLRRVQHLVDIVLKVYAKDRYRRTISRDDARLSAGSGHTLRDGARALPARVTGITTNVDHRRELLDRTFERLSQDSLDVFVIPNGTGWPDRIGVLDPDWHRALTLLSDSDLGILIGEEHPYEAAGVAGRLKELKDAPEFQEHESVILVDPAVTLGKTGRVAARYGLREPLGLMRWSFGEDDTWHPARPSAHVAQLPPEPHFDATLETVSGAYPTARELATPNLTTVSFPIDVVYTWVDGTDPAWLKRKRAAVEQVSGDRLTEDAAADLRFVDHDELRYSLRSIEQYAPWVRHIWIVTDRQRPDWLAEDHPRVSVVDHTDIAPASSSLPTFNSHAIEANLHRIQGLSEHFLYFNDDVFLSSPVQPDLFFSPNGIAHLYLSRAQVAPGAPEEGEPASDSAGKNARRMVEEVSGRRLSRKLFHAPFPLQRSVSHEIEEQWPHEVEETRRSPFRRISDITLSGGLHMNYAYATGRAVTRRLRYRYVNVGGIDAVKDLQNLHTDAHLLQTFCLNEATDDLPPEEIDALVRGFLRRQFPDRSTFETEG